MCNCSIKQPDRTCRLGTELQRKISVMYQGIRDDEFTSLTRKERDDAWDTYNRYVKQYIEHIETRKG